MAHYETGRAEFEAAARLQGRAGSAGERILKCREAAEALGRAVREDESYAEAWHLRGLVRFRLAEFGGAEQDFSAAAQLGVLEDKILKASQPSSRARAAARSRRPAIEVWIPMRTTRRPVGWRRCSRG